MRLVANHANYLANKIATDLLKSGLVTFTSGTESVSKVAYELILDDIHLEKEINTKANILLEEQMEDIEFFQADRKQLFWMVKQKIANEEGFNLRWEDRIGDLSHHILDELYEEDLINYHVSENLIKNVIFHSIEEYLKRQDEIEERVHDKMSHYKRKLVYGSEEYEIVFAKLYEEELRKLGL